MTSLNPVFTCGEQIAEAHAPARGAQPARRHGQDGRHAEAGPHPERRAPREGVPAPALGRHAAADHDRDGALLQSEAPHRRRADHRARRHHPGADPRAAQRAEGQARHGDHAHHPRHGRHRGDRAARGRDVRGQGRRGGAGRPSCSRSRCTRTRRACCAPSRASTSPPPRGRRLETIPGTVPTLRGAEIAPGCRVRAALPVREIGHALREGSRRSRKSGPATKWPAGSTRGHAMAETALLRDQEPQEVLPDSRRALLARSRAGARGRRRDASTC